MSKEAHLQTLGLASNATREEIESRYDLLCEILDPALIEHQLLSKIAARAQQRVEKSYSFLDKAYPSLKPVIEIVQEDIVLPAGKLPPPLPPSAQGPDNTKTELEASKSLLAKSTTEPAAPSAPPNIYAEQADSVELISDSIPPANLSAPITQKTQVDHISTAEKKLTNLWVSDPFPLTADWWELNKGTVNSILALILAALLFFPQWFNPDKKVSSGGSGQVEGATKVPVLDSSTGTETGPEKTTPNTDIVRPANPFEDPGSGGESRPVERISSSEESVKGGEEIDSTSFGGPGKPANPFEGDMASNQSASQNPSTSSPISSSDFELKHMNPTLDPKELLQDGSQQGSLATTTGSESQIHRQLSEQPVPSSPNPLVEFFGPVLLIVILLSAFGMMSTGQMKGLAAAVFDLTFSIIKLVLSIVARYLPLLVKSLLGLLGFIATAAADEIAKDKAAKKLKKDKELGIPPSVPLIQGVFKPESKAPKVYSSVSDDTGIKTSASAPFINPFLKETPNADPQAKTKTNPFLEKLDDIGATPSATASAPASHSSQFGLTKSASSVDKLNNMVNVNPYDDPPDIDIIEK